MSDFLDVFMYMGAFFINLTGTLVILILVPFGVIEILLFRKPGYKIATLKNLLVITGREIKKLWTQKYGRIK
jgi:hypothetical protein